MKKIGVVVFDNHLYTNDGWEKIFSAAEDIQFLNVTSVMLKLTELIFEYKPDVLVFGIDGQSLRISSIEFLSFIRERYPLIKIVMITADSELSELARREGVYCVSEASSPQALLNLIRWAAYLTPLEQNVLGLLCEGKSDREIALETGRFERTIKKEISNILQKLNAKNRTEAATIAHRYSLVGVHYEDVPIFPVNSTPFLARVYPPKDGDMPDLLFSQPEQFHSLEKVDINPISNQGDESGVNLQTLEKVDDTNKRIIKKNSSIDSLSDERRTDISVLNNSTETSKLIEKSNTKHHLRVFLCHAHSDSDEVRKVYERLLESDIDVWFDKEKLLPGSDWEFEIRNAVTESDVVVICLSKNFNQRGFRQKEVRLAIEVAMEQPEGEIFIIPARLEECESLESLKKWHWVDIFETDGFDKLFRALKVRAQKVGARLE